MQHFCFLIQRESNACWNSKTRVLKDLKSTHKPLLLGVLYPLLASPRHGHDHLAAMAMSALVSRLSSFLLTHKSTLKRATHPVLTYNT